MDILNHWEPDVHMIKNLVDDVRFNLICIFCEELNLLKVNLLNQDFIKKPIDAN